MPLSFIAICVLKNKSKSVSAIYDIFIASYGFFVDSSKFPYLQIYDTIERLKRLPDDVLIGISQLS